MIVRGLDGQPIPVSLDWIEPLSFARWHDGRFFGFSFSGYEAESQLLDGLGPAAGTAVAFAAGRLVEREETRRLDTRAAWPAAWQAVVDNS